MGKHCSVAPSAAMAFSTISNYQISPLSNTSGHRSEVVGCGYTRLISSFSCPLSPLYMRCRRHLQLGSAGGFSETTARAMQKRGLQYPGMTYCAATEETASTTGTENAAEKAGSTSPPPPRSPKPSPFSTAGKKIGGSSGETRGSGDAKLSGGGTGPTGSTGSKPTPNVSARGEKSREAEKKLLASGSMRPTTSFGSKKLLDAFKEGDKFDTKVKVGQPKAPANIFTDSVRTAEEIEADKWVFRLDRGQSLLVLSFFASSVLMFATVWFVWKVGAIHFNEY